MDFAIFVIKILGFSILGTVALVAFIGFGQDGYAFLSKELPIPQGRMETAYKFVAIGAFMTYVVIDIAMLAGILLGVLYLAYLLSQIN